MGVRSVFNVRHGNTQSCWATANGKRNHGNKDLECSGLFRCKAVQFTSFVQKRIPYREYVPDVGGRLVTKCCAC